MGEPKKIRHRHIEQTDACFSTRCPDGKIRKVYSQWKTGLFVNVKSHKRIYGIVDEINGEMKFEPWYWAKGKEEIGG